MPAAPHYDAWAWLTWGREIAHGSLSTAEGPAWKPLPVLVTGLFAGAWPALWVLIARAGAVVAVWCAYRLGGWLAAVGVALTGGYVSLSSQGSSEGLLLAFALGGVLALREGRDRIAVGCFVTCALLRVETWLFLVGLAWWYGWRWRIVLVAAAVLALWFIPEWIGSGELLRSADRARMPNPGVEPGFLESLGDALVLLVWPLAIFAVVGDRVLAAVGAAWILLVAVMAEAGFSGEWRYALPGAALLAVAGAQGLKGRAWWLAVPVAVVAVVRVADWPAIRERETFRAEQVSDLRRVAHLSCDQPYVGRFRGTLLAYQLGVEKQRIDFAPRAPGTVFRSRLGADSPPSPAVPPGFRTVAANRSWSVHTTCVRQP